MNITYKRNRFLIECLFSENNRIKAIPSVRFDRRNSVWVCQNLNRNCAHLMGHFRKELTMDLVAVCEETLAKTKVVYKCFPSWFEFKTKPYNHQVVALDSAYNLRRSALFMEMGTGKTKVAIDLFSCHFMENKIDCWVVFCPVNVKSVWEKKELPMHLPIDVPVYALTTGKKRIEKQITEIKEQERFIVIVGIESFSVGDKRGAAYAGIQDLIIGRKVGVTIDESHNCKSHDSFRSKNIQRLVEGSIVMNIMTGTPTSQGFIDLFMQFEILDPHILGFGNYYAFRARYAVMGGYKDKQIVNYENIEELIELIAPFTYQCTKEEVLDLPPKIYEPVYVNLTPEQQKLYNQMNSEMAVKLPRKESEIEVYVEHAMTKYGVLQQITGGFINYDDEEYPLKYIGKDGEEHVRYRRVAEILVQPSKNPKIKEILRVATEHPKEQIIVWAKYRTEIAMIKQAMEEEFGNMSCSEYHGGIKKDDRDEEERKFNEKETRFMLSNQQTGGVGRTWTVCSLVVYYSNDFRMVNRVQSEDRVHRIGQESKKVVYIDITANMTKDEDILEAIEAKMDLAEFLRKQITEQWLTRVGS